MKKVNIFFLLLFISSHSDIYHKDDGVIHVICKIYIKKQMMMAQNIVRYKYYFIRKGSTDKENNVKKNVLFIFTSTTTITQYKKLFTI